MNNFKFKIKNKKSRHPRVVIAGNHGSSGKTTVAIGLCAALVREGITVQPFKKGPDFIDPMWLTAASGNRACRNLDFFMMEKQISNTFHDASSDAEFSIIEGNKGLHDGLDLEGSNSTAGLARLLKAPVVLVVDCRKMTRGIAPLLMGYINFEPDINIAGVILNRVAGKRHEQKLRDAIKRFCDIEVLGAIPRQVDLEIDERHLGLIPVKEHPGASIMIDKIAQIVTENIDLQRFMEIGCDVPELSLVRKQESVNSVAAISNASPGSKKVKIGVAMDRAFTFYYPENLEALKQAGAELIPFSPMKDSYLPDVDGLYINGGFPELFMKELESNWALREEIRHAIFNGLPVYAECGGLMYLAKSIAWNGKKCEMVGGLPCEIEVTSKPQGKGYMNLKTGAAYMKQSDENNLWKLPENITIQAHEFHYSKMTNCCNEIRFAYEVKRGFGLNGQQDGIMSHNVLSSYAHLHSHSAPWWAPAFVGAVNKYRAVSCEAEAELSLAT